MACMDLAATFDTIPVVSFWDSSSSLEGEFGAAFRLSGTRHPVAGDEEFVEKTMAAQPKANASLASLPEEIMCCNDERSRPDEVTPRSVADSEALLCPTLLQSLRCQKTAWTSLGQCASRTAGVHIETKRTMEGSEDDMIECGNVLAPPSQPPRRASLSAPVSKGVAVSRQCPQERMNAMVPMLRARHMELLDARYLKDRDVRVAAAEVRNGVRSRSCSRRSTPPAAAAQRGHSAGSVRPQGHQGHRALGPNAVMPIVKGQLKVQAEIAQRVADRESRENKLKEQFRSRPAASSRPKSQGRTVKTQH